MKNKKKRFHLYPESETDQFVDQVILWLVGIFLYSRHELIEIHVAHTIPSDCFGGVSLQFVGFDIGIFLFEDGIRVRARNGSNNYVVLYSLKEVIEYVESI